jgi:lipoate-protein ligase B
MNTNGKYRVYFFRMFGMCGTCSSEWSGTEHPAVFTQGISGKAENLLQNSNIPVVQSDRGGQITYHGPGQLLGTVVL